MDTPPGRPGTDGHGTDGHGAVGGPADGATVPASGAVPSGWRLRLLGVAHALLGPAGAVQRLVGDGKSGDWNGLTSAVRSTFGGSAETTVPGAASTERNTPAAASTGERTWPAWYFDEPCSGLPQRAEEGTWADGECADPSSEEAVRFGDEPYADPPFDAPSPQVALAVAGACHEQAQRLGERTPQSAVDLLLPYVNNYDAACRLMLTRIELANCGAFDEPMRGPRLCWTREDGLVGAKDDVPF